RRRRDVAGGGEIHPELQAEGAVRRQSHRLQSAVLGDGARHRRSLHPRRAAALMVEADVVISSTAATGVVIDAAMVKRAQAARRGRPLILLDIAMPRDIDPECAKLEEVYLFDIDDLQQ